MNSPSSETSRHRAHDDLNALVTAALLFSLGLVLFKNAGMLTGGTAGLAFLLHYATGWSFGLCFSLINLPFYGLAWQRKGAVFTFKTLVVVTTVSLLVEATQRWIDIAQLQPVYAAIMGGS